MKTLLIFISTLFLFSCGEAKENIYLQCHNADIDSTKLVTLDFENMVGIYAATDSDWSNKGPLKITDRFYSFKNGKLSYSLNRVSMNLSASLSGKDKITTISYQCRIVNKI